MLRAGAVHAGARRRLARVGPGRPDVHRLRQRRRGHRARPLPSGDGPRARPSRRARSGTCRTGSPTSPRCGSRKRLIDNTFAERVFFCNSGAEANEAALKLARRYAHDRFGAQEDPRRSRRSTRSTAARCSPSPPAARPSTRRGFGPESGGLHAHPATTTSRRSKREFAEHGDEICAVILEPMQGEGGMTPGTPEFLQAARRLCTQHDALLILDEIQSGMGRTGALFSYMQKGVVPDILTSAKGLGGGFPDRRDAHDDRDRERVHGRRARHDLRRQSARVRGRRRGVRRHQHHRGARRRQGAARAVHGRPEGDQRAPPRVLPTCAAKACGSAASSTTPWKGKAMDVVQRRRRRGPACCSSPGPTSCASRRRSSSRSTKSSRAWRGSKRRSNRALV